MYGYRYMEESADFNLVKGDIMEKTNENIKVPLTMVEKLRNFAQQIHVLQNYISLIGETILKTEGKEGNYSFSATYDELICNNKNPNHKP